MVVICPDCKNENTEDAGFCGTCGTPVGATGEKLFAGRYHILSVPAGT